MEETRKFGARIKELRVQLHLTQRQLAEKVGVDFTYLSKIETGALPPPSEKVILRLAEVLNPDKEAQELSALIARRRQYIAMITAERNRSSRASPSIQSEIAEHVVWMKDKLKKLDEELAQILQLSPLWRAREKLLRSVPGVPDLTPKNKSSLHVRLANKKKGAVK
ncbi:MAG: helix-turn-helix domain-containing protein, partial [Chloroflexota bacterium]